MVRAVDDKEKSQTMGARPGLISSRVGAVDYPCIYQKRPRRTRGKPSRRLWTIKDEKEASEAELEASKKQVEAADAAEHIKNRLNDPHS